MAAAAAGCYDTAYALQALEARHAPGRHALRLTLLGHLARRRRWLGAAALSVTGWPLQLFALSLAPLTLVQPTLALGLLLLLALGVRVLGEPVGRRELAAVLVILAGVAALAAAAPPRTTDHATGVELAAGLAGLGLIALAPFAIRAAGREPGVALIVAAGAGDAWAAFAAKLVVDELSHESRAAAVAWAIGAALALGAGLLSEMTALQRYAATRVGPIVVVIQVAVPVLLATILGGESWGGTPLGGVVLALALAAVVAGAAVLGSSPPVSGLLVRPREDERRR